MILNIMLLILTIPIPMKCSSVIDAFQQKTIYVSNYCPKMKYCKEGSHVMCMYYDHNRPHGPRCSNFVNTHISPQMVEQVLKTVNLIRSKVATGQETGKDNELLPRAYGMMRMGWDSELATLAQVLANQCLGGKEDLCRATDKFPNPSQSIAIIQFKYPHWEYLNMNVSQTGELNNEKLAFAIEKYLKALYSLKKTVTQDMIGKCPPMVKLPSYYSKLYLNLIRGGATHIGCGLSAYTRYSISKNGRQSIHNCIEMVCNISDGPQPLEPLYVTEPPLPGLGYTEECGCPRGYKETSGCLCEADGFHHDNTIAPNVTQAKGMHATPQWLNTGSQAQLQTHAQSQVKAQQRIPQQEQPKARQVELPAQLETHPHQQSQQAKTQLWMQPHPKVQAHPQPWTNAKTPTKPRSDFWTKDQQNTQHTAQTKAQTQMQPKVSQAVQIDPLNNEGLKTCTDPTGNCQSQVLLLPIFSIQDAPAGQFMDKTLRTDHIKDDNFFSADNTSIVLRELTLDKSEMKTHMERANKPKKGKQQPQFYESFEKESEPSLNDQIMMSNVFKNKQKKGRLAALNQYEQEAEQEFSGLLHGAVPKDQTMILTEINEKPKKKNIQRPDTKHKSSTRGSSPITQLIEQSELKVKDKSKKPFTIPEMELNKHELYRTKDVESQKRYKNQTLIDVKGDNINDKNNDDDTRLMSLIDNLEKEVRHVELRGDTKKIVNARMKKIYESIQNRFKDNEYSKQDATTSRTMDDHKSKLNNSALHSDIELPRKDTKVEKNNNKEPSIKKHDDQGERNIKNNLDDKLIEILSQSVDKTENPYQSGNKYNIDNVDNDNIFREQMNNDDKDQNDKENTDTNTNENLFRQYDDNDEFDYNNKAMTRNQNTLTNYNNNMFIERKSELGSIGALRSGPSSLIDPTNYNIKESRVEANIPTEHQEVVIGRRKFSYFESPEMNTANRNFRPIQEYKGNPPMRRMQINKDEVYSRSKLKPHEDNAFLGDRAMLYL